MPCAHRALRQLPPQYSKETAGDYNSKCPVWLQPAWNLLLQQLKPTETCSPDTSAATRSAQDSLQTDTGGRYSNYKPHFTDWQDTESSCPHFDTWMLRVQLLLQLSAVGAEGLCMQPSTGIPIRAAGLLCHAGCLLQRERNDTSCKWCPDPARLPHAYLLV